MIIINYISFQSTKTSECSHLFSSFIIPVQFMRLRSGDDCVSMTLDDDIRAHTGKSLTDCAMSMAEMAVIKVEHLETEISDNVRNSGKQQKVTCTFAN